MWSVSSFMWGLGGLHTLSVASCFLSSVLGAGDTCGPKLVVVQDLGESSSGLVAV